MLTNKIQVTDKHSKETKIVAGALAATLTAVSVLAVATQKLLESIKTDEDNDRSW